MSADVVLLIVLLFVTNAIWFGALFYLDGAWEAHCARLMEDSDYEWVDYECRDGKWTVKPASASRKTLLRQHMEDWLKCRRNGITTPSLWETRAWLAQSRAVTEPGSVPEPSTVDSGCSSKVQPSVCFRCGLVIFDGLHRNGYRECYMDEIEVAP